MVKFKWEEEFKDTAFGKIPEDWEVSFLGDKTKFEIIMGQSPPSKYYNKEGRGMPFAQGKKEFGELYINPTIFTTQCSKIAPPNSVLITVRAPVGELNLTKSELCIGRGIAAILDKSGNPLRNRFIFCALKGLSEYLSMLGQRGTTYESITKEELDVISIPYPHSFEQECIASVLSWFDDLIENKKRQNEVLEKVAMAVFKSWFVDFEPFRDGEFVPSELGEIPKGWEVRKVHEIFVPLKGKNCSLSEQFIDGYKPYLGVETYETGIIKYWTRENKPLVDELDTVLIADGEGSGKVFRYQKGILGSTLLALKPKVDDKKLQHLIYLWLKSMENELMYHRTGTYIQHLDKDYLLGLKITIPRDNDLNKFHSIVDPLFQKIILNQKQILVLKKVRDLLLPLLVFGRLRVEEI